MRAIFAPIVQWIEHQPSKLAMRVRFPLGVLFYKLNFKFMEENKDEVEVLEVDDQGQCDCSCCSHHCGSEEDSE